MKGGGETTDANHLIVDHDPWSPTSPVWPSETCALPCPSLSFWCSPVRPRAVRRAPQAPPAASGQHPEDPAWRTLQEAYEGNIDPEESKTMKGGLRR